MYICEYAENNNLVKHDCNACGIQVNLSLDLEIPTC